MGLLNKSNKTKTILAMGDVSDNIRTDIIQPNITSEQMDFCKELSNKVAKLDVDVLYEKWDENIVPSLGLGYDKELYVTGGTSRGRYMMEHQIVHKNGSATTYITTICFDKEMIKGIPMRTYQRMHTDGIKWIDDGVPNIFGINKIPVNTAYDVFRIE